jgi:twitching motility protein PilT
MYSAIQTGGAHGMQTLDQTLQDMVTKNLIARQDARMAAQNKDQFN